MDAMSQDYQQGGIFSFLNGFDRSQQEQEQEHHKQIIPRDNKMRLQGFHPPPPRPPPRLVAIEEVEESNGVPGYETTGMLSEMFNFTSGPASSTTAHTLSLAERGQFPTTTTATTTTDWYGRHEAMVVGGGGGCLGQLDSSNDHNDNHHQTQQISGLNATDSARAMQLFLMNPQPAARSPSPSPSSHHHHHPSASSSTPHMLLLPNPSPTSTLHHHHHSPTANINPFGPSQFPWVNQDRYNQSQGLSLTLSSSLQAGNKKQLADDDDDLRLGEISGMLLFNNHHQPLMHMDHHNQQIHHMGYESSLGTVNGLRNSKYSKATQELLQEFCSIGSRGGQLLLKKNKQQLIIKQETNINPNPNNNNNDYNNNPSGTGVGGNSSSSSKDPPPPLPAADRLEHQRRKVKLLSMLDEVDKRYNHYCEQMQMVVNSFDLMMGFGAAVPYTALAQKAMSRHFRCFKDSIAMQLKQSCELLGEKDTSGTSGVTKGETPRLKLLEQNIRQQRAFHQMGMMMDQEAWRPQRGLPELSVNILRAWLFDHFLHPYPSDADKHLLARQTGLSKNQVSNWFINARVRLWKPMVEEMYQHESKEQDEDEDEEEGGREREINPNNNNNDNIINAQTMQNTAATATAERSEFNDCYKNNPSLNRQHPTTTNSSFTGGTPTAATLMSAPFPPAIIIHDETSGSKDELGSTLIRFGKSAGDVSLTLGLRHTGNLPENNNNFAVTDFAGF